MQKTQAAAAEVIGTGVLLDGSNVYIVSSQTEPGRSHVVQQLPTRLACDCKAASYGKRCAHVAAVIAHKQRQQLALARAADVVAEVRAVRTVPTGYGAPSAPRESLLNRTRAFSLLRQ